MGRNMRAEDGDAQITKLKAQAESTSDDTKKCFCLLIAAELSVQIEHHKQAIELCEQATSLVPSLSPFGQLRGCEPVLYYIKARAFFDSGDLVNAKTALKRWNTFRK